MFSMVPLTSSDNLNHCITYELMKNPPSDDVSEMLLKDGWEKTGGTTCIVLWAGQLHGSPLKQLDLCTLWHNTPLLHTLVLAFFKGVST